MREYPKREEKEAREEHLKEENDVKRKQSQGNKIRSKVNKERV